MQLLIRENSAGIADAQGTVGHHELLGGLGISGLNGEACPARRNLLRPAEVETTVLPVAAGKAQRQRLAGP